MKLKFLFLILLMVQLADAKSTIQITSTNTVLKKSLHGTCIIDINFGASFKPKDILSDPYLSLVKALNWQELNMSGGSNSFYQHAIVGDDLVTGGIGDGYNPRDYDFNGSGETRTSFSGGVMNQSFGKDFFNEDVVFAKSLATPLDILFNVWNGTWQECQWQIEQGNSTLIQLGMELNVRGVDAYVYAQNSTELIDNLRYTFPKVLIGGDAPPADSKQPKDKDWRKATQKLDVDFWRWYFWDRDLFTEGKTFIETLANMNVAFASVLPARISSFHTTYPGDQIGIWQWGVKYSTSTYYNTALENIYIGKFYKWMIENQTDIAVASWMPFKDCIDNKNVPKNFYYALESAGKLFTANAKVCKLTCTLNGVSGVAVKDGTTTTLLLINETGVDVSFSSVNIDGADRFPMFKTSGWFGDSLEDAVLSSFSNTSSTAVAKKYGVTVISF